MNAISLTDLLDYIITEVQERAETKEDALEILYRFRELVREHNYDRLRSEFGII